MGAEKEKRLRLLFVGNSFAVDTGTYLPEIARALGREEVVVGILYIGGCSINMHDRNAAQDLPVYKYHLHCGEGWTVTPETRISDAVRAYEWDDIVIQHGVKDGSRVTLKECYARLPALVRYLKALAAGDPRIGFNMPWISEPWHHHIDIRAFDGDQVAYYARLCAIMQETVLGCDGIDFVVPSGTAIQNARTSKVEALTRDGHHLSCGMGRYTAALTLYKTLTGEDLGAVGWIPEGLGEYEQKVAILSAELAVKTPFSVTPLLDGEL